jgi:C1A family cysteine protease
MFNFLENINNYFSAPKYYYGWKKNDTWENIILNMSYNGFLSRFFIYYNYYNNIKNIDLRDKCPDIYNQESLGSCTANALAFGYEYTELIQHNKKEFMPSRLFIYYNERVIEDAVPTDSGASLSDGIKTLKNIGVCPESQWKYDISAFAVKPTDECYKTAKLHQINSYYAIKQELNQLKSALIQGFPIVFGFVVYSNFEDISVKNAGIMKMPTDNDTIVGGHAVAAVGFDDKNKHFIIRNSWGVEWGDKGYFYMPYDYILDTKLASDFWCITHSN